MGHSTHHSISQKTAINIHHTACRYQLFVFVHFLKFGGYSELATYTDIDPIHA